MGQQVLLAYSQFQRRATVALRVWSAWIGTHGVISVRLCRCGLCKCAQARPDQTGDQVELGGMRVRCRGHIAGLLPVAMQALLFSITLQ